MTDKAGGPVIKEKVKPYPFKAELEINAQRKPVEILQVTLLGFIIKIEAHLIYVGEHYKCFFELPFFKDVVSGPVRVIKTYDRSIDPKSHIVERVAELHFESLENSHKTAIQRFMIAFGQK